MERVELPQLHEHPLIAFNRFPFSGCQVCSHFFSEFDVNAYGGYCCNELGCEEAVFHKECAKPLKEINHSFHPDHPLKLIIPTFPLKYSQPHICFCGRVFKVGYCCSLCDFKLDLECARRPEPLILLKNSYGHRHEHPLKLICDCEPYFGIRWEFCKVCVKGLDPVDPYYRCQECKEYSFHVDCVDFF